MPGIVLRHCLARGLIWPLLGLIILAGELKSAEGDYPVAFKGYNELMRPFVDAYQDLGAWVREKYLSEDEATKEIIE